LKELIDIVNAYDLAQRSGKHTALATVVHVDGSSYRRAGARMLITEDGQLTGAISGGCLEGDALRKARLAMVQQKSMLVTYDTTDEDDAKFGVGLGCNGVIQILIEPILHEQPVNPIQFFKAFLSERNHVVLITVFNMEDRHQKQHGTCLLIGKNGRITGQLNDSALAEEVLNDARQVFDQGSNSNEIYLYHNGYTCFIELLEPAVSLVIAGAGNDAMPLLQIAAVLGWSVTLVDGRANYNTAERFPLAGKQIIAKPEDVPGRITIDSRTVFMLMTHNYNYDLTLLTELMPFKIPYIGILGPKKRLVRMLEEITNAPVTDENIPQHIHGPAGLNIGSENSEEIAVAIIAEIQAVLKKQDALPLKTKEHIHDRSGKITANPTVNQ
jgi:xanthine dehydrogenase accessory factor